MSKTIISERHVPVCLLKNDAKGAFFSSLSLFFCSWCFSCCGKMTFRQERYLSRRVVFRKKRKKPWKIVSFRGLLLCLSSYEIPTTSWCERWTQEKEKLRFPFSFSSFFPPRSFSHSFLVDFTVSHDDWEDRNPFWQQPQRNHSRQWVYLVYASLPPGFSMSRPIIWVVWFTYSGHFPGMIDDLTSQRTMKYFTVSNREGRRRAEAAS